MTTPRIPIVGQTPGHDWEPLTYTDGKPVNYNRTELVRILCLSHASVEVALGKKKTAEVEGEDGAADTETPWLPLQGDVGLIRLSFHDAVTIRGGQPMIVRNAERAGHGDAEILFGSSDDFGADLHVTIGPTGPDQE